MKITSAEFVISAWRSSDYPKCSLPEVAFAGRSNVGKSSLINVLVNRKKLVKTSSTPGKTQSINFFNINNTIMFVDLPGYGFAKVPMSVRKRWKPLVEGYLKGRKTLQLTLLILDVRRTPSEEDISLLDWFNFYRIPTVVVLSKIDKLSKSKLKKQIELMRKSLPFEPEKIVPFSAVTRDGKEEIWKHILNSVDKEGETFYS
ncbi:MAG: ribosome biogenesis GTP-binding protein YihA/YsxC [Thermodesulfobacteriota bacterium]|nr:ribosome biogenesis GTP-binding protein YihA/YsxC [Thermodesulfobacteriota bacterium]